MIRAVILDFDGVVLESVEVKTEAFRELFSFAPDHAEAIVQFHKENGGMSRYDKFDYFYKNILGVPLTSEKKQELADKFSDIVFKKILAVPFVPGAYEFLQKYSGSVSLFVVSATPENELREILRQRDLTRFFQGVYGAPREKTDCIREIISKLGVPASDILFVGDALNDFAAARAAGIPFVGRIAPGEKNVFYGRSGIVKVVTDLSEFSGFLEGLS